MIFLPVLLGPDFGRTDAATEPTRAAIGRGGGPFVFCSLVEQLFASSATGAKAAVDHQKGADAKTKGFEANRQRQSQGRQGVGRQGR